MLLTAGSVVESGRVAPLGRSGSGAAGLRPSHAATASDKHESPRSYVRIGVDDWLTTAPDNPTLGPGDDGTGCKSESVSRRGHGADGRQPHDVERLRQVRRD